MVSGTYNLNGATDVPINSKVAAYFSTHMDPLTLTTTTFTLRQGNTLIPGAVTYSGISATFIPTADLAPNTEYTATVTTGAKDLAGNSLAVNKVWTFTTGAAPDTTAPVMGNSIPASSQTGVALNSGISAIFSEVMDHSTLTTTTFTLKQGNTPVSGTVAYVGVTAVFVPAATLAPSTEYTATITTGAKDLAGNPLAVNKVWKFTTGPGPDITAPMVSSTVPISPTSGMPINGKITATFSEAIDPLTLTTTTFTLKQGSTPVSGEVTYVGLTATFTPDSFLAAGTAYTATITTGAKDLAGNALAVNKVWTFTTFASGGGGGGGGGGDTTAPTVSSTVPVNAATGVAINSAMTATFSEAMLASTVTNVTFTLKQGVTPVAGQVIYAGFTATFTPDDPLANGTPYTATISTVVTDLAGNHLAVNKVWTFTTGAAPDVTAPTVSSTIPANAATGVAISSNPTATFSEAMLASTVTNVTFTMAQGLTPVTGQVIYAGLTATFIPDAPLVNDTLYTATISTVVTDLAGNHLAVDKVWTFRTAVLLAGNPTAPDLGEAGRYVILASQTVTTTGTTAISGGDMAVIDQARSYLTTGGFTPVGPAGDFTQLTGGTSFAADDANPLPFPYPLKYATPVIGDPWATTLALINQTRTDLGIAYAFLAFDPNPTSATQACPADLGGLTLTRGVYKTAVGVTIPTALTLSGSATDIFIFSIDGGLTVGASIILDGVLPQNVYWRVAGITSIAAGITFYGNVFSFEQINVFDGAHVTGRLFSVNEQVTLIGDTVVYP